ncbi:SRPBCC domain-containing protein [Caulifigura coniformis]|uniref:SRPBCC domain-containing protein n=1 Tax=Caulifigura coniformis TaxID=2527983 RepID=UPI0018D21E33
MGVTSTFEQFESRPGGKWVFTMHGPHGASDDYESLFHELEPERRIVIEFRPPSGRDGKLDGLSPDPALDVSRHDTRRP